MTLAAHITKARKGLIKTINSVLDPLVVRALITNADQELKIDVNDAPIIKNAKALLNVLLHCETLAKGFSLGSINALRRVRYHFTALDFTELKKMAAIIAGQKDTAQRHMQDAFTLVESTIGLKQGLLAKMLIGEGAASSDKSGFADTIAHGVKRLGVMANGDPNNIPKVGDDPWLATQIDAITGAIESSIVNNFAAPVAAQFVKIGARYPKKAGDSTRVENAKQLLNALAAMRDVVTNCYNKRTYLWRMATISISANEVRQALLSIDYGAHTRESSVELNLLLREGLAHLAPVLSAVMVKLDQFEELTYLKQGIISEQFSDCLDIYNRLLEAAKVELAEPVSFWASRLVAAEARLRASHQQILELKQTETQLQYQRDDICSRYEEKQEKSNWFSRAVRSVKHRTGHSKYVSALTKIDARLQETHAQLNTLNLQVNMMQSRVQQMRVQHNAWQIENNARMEERLAKQPDKRLQLLTVLKVALADKGWHKEGWGFLFLWRKTPAEIKALRAALKDLSEVNHIHKLHQVMHVLNEYLGKDEKRPWLRSKATHRLLCQYKRALVEETALQQQQLGAYKKMLALPDVPTLLPAVVAPVPAAIDAAVVQKEVRLHPPLAVALVV